MSSFISWKILRDEQRKKEEDQRAKLEKIHGMDKMPRNVRDLIWNKAWDDGHSEGYHRVDGIYEELSEIAEAVWEAKQ